MSQKTSNKKPFKEPEFSAFIAIDWADQKHDISMQLAGQTKKTTRTIEHTPEALNDWVNELRQQFGSGKIAVCLEQSKGALINFLINHDLFILLKWPTLQELQKAKNTTIEKFYHQHHCYGKELITRRIKLIQQAIPLTTDQAILMTSEEDGISRRVTTWGVRMVTSVFERVTPICKIILELADLIP